VAELDVLSRTPQVILGDGPQHRGFVGAADEDLADELARMNCLLGGEAMVARIRTMSGSRSTTW